MDSGTHKSGNLLFKTGKDDYSKIYDTIESYIVQFAEDNDLTYEVEELEVESAEIEREEYR